MPSQSDQWPQNEESDYGFREGKVDVTFDMNIDFCNRTSQIGAESTHQQQEEGHAAGRRVSTHRTPSLTRLSDRVQRTTRSFARHLLEGPGTDTNDITDDMSSAPEMQNTNGGSPSFNLLVTLPESSEQVMSSGPGAGTHEAASGTRSEDAGKLPHGTLTATFAPRFGTASQSSMKFRGFRVYVSTTGGEEETRWGRHLETILQHSSNRKVWTEDQGISDSLTGLLEHLTVLRRKASSRTVEESSLPSKIRLKLQQAYADFVQASRSLQVELLERACDRFSKDQPAGRPRKIEYIQPVYVSYSDCIREELPSPFDH